MFMHLFDRSAGFQLVCRCCHGEKVASTSVHVCPECFRQPH